MYNAKRLAHSAQKAERDGRTFEANNLWGQVATRAESVVVRHPRSKYVDEALVLQGIALSRLGQCPQAVAPLGRTGLLPRGSDLMEEATLALGRCQLELGSPAAADLAFARVIESTDRTRRREARLQHGRALRRTGQYDQAVAVLQELHDPRGEQDLLLALAGSGRRDDALALADTVLARKDSTMRWDSVLVILGDRDPVAASELVDRLLASPTTPDDARARWLEEDGDRLAAVDSSRARARLREATAAGEGTGSGERAALELLRLDLARVKDPAELRVLFDSLRRERPRSAPSNEMLQLGFLAARVVGAADSMMPQTPRGDLRLFLAAESARDSLEAPLLAASLFRLTVERWPASPYAPKALLAVSRLDSSWTDSARALLEGPYASSPYVAVLRGEDPPAYQTLEDSLRAFAVSLPVDRPPGPRRPGVRPERPPVNDELPGRAPAENRPRPGGSRRPVEP
jgi:tetratricopeptide (TPR) repeat protein